MTTIAATDGKARCAWPHDDPLMLAYHDGEWGVPEHDGRALYEKLILDGAQAGLSWRTILHRREGYRKAFRGFHPDKIARWGPREIERLAADAGIIRNRAKIRSAIKNAQAFLAVQDEHGSFDALLWDFVDGKTIVNRWKRLNQLPASTPLSERISKELKRRGFTFVGPTIIYAFMQAIGMVNDHVTDCYRWQEVQRQTR